MVDTLQEGGGQGPLTAAFSFRFELMVFAVSQCEEKPGLLLRSLNCAGGRAVHGHHAGGRSRSGVVVGDGRSEERRVGKSVDLGGRRIIKKKKIVSGGWRCCGCNTCFTGKRA